MEDLITQLNESAGVLILLIPPLVELLKKIPIVKKLQKDIPLYEIISVVLGVAGAYALNVNAPIIQGIIAGLAAGKGYDFVKGDKK